MSQHQPDKEDMQKAIRAMRDSLQEREKKVRGKLKVVEIAQAAQRQIVSAALIRIEQHRGDLQRICTHPRGVHQVNKDFHSLTCEDCGLDIMYLFDLDEKPKKKRSKKKTGEVQE